MDEETVEITTKDGTVFLIDKADFELVNAHKWHASLRKDKKTKSIAGSVRIDGEKKVMFLHRFLLNPPKGLYVDHINRNPLDNRRSNLRICTHEENARNTTIHKDNTTGYKGIYPDQGKYSVVVMKDRKRFYGGWFADPVEAARKYDELALKHHGEFASLNFPITRTP